MPTPSHKGHPYQKGGLVFRYTSAPYRKYPLFQLLAYLVFAVGVVVYFQWFSPWKGGFIRVRAAYLPIFGFLGIFLAGTCLRPIVDLLSARNEHIVVTGDQLHYYNRLGRLSFSSPLHDIELFRAGKPITSGVTGGVKRYIFKGKNGKFFNFAADIDDAEQLLTLLHTEP